MSSRTHACRFQAILFSYKDEPLRVLGERFLPADECTLDAAKAMMMIRFEDRSYARKYGALWPDAVRFLNERGEEILRYTCWSYLRESTAAQSDQDQAA